MYASVNLIVMKHVPPFCRFDTFPMLLAKLKSGPYIFKLWTNSYMIWINVHSWTTLSYVQVDVV